MSSIFGVPKRSFVNLFTVHNWIMNNESLSLVNLHHLLLFLLSYDEMAAYDLPSMIDYVLNATGHKRINYIGFSMGTTAVFAMLSTKSEYNNKARNNSFR